MQKVDHESVRIGGHRLDLERLYTATVNEGSASLLDLLGVHVEELTDLPDLEFSVLRDYVARHPVVVSTSRGRILDVARTATRSPPKR